MKKSKKFSPEAHERAVRIVQDHRGVCPSLCLPPSSRSAPRLAVFRTSSQRSNGCPDLTFIACLSPSATYPRQRLGLTTTATRQSDRHSEGLTETK